MKFDRLTVTTSPHSALSAAARVVAWSDGCRVNILYTLVAPHAFRDTRCCLSCCRASCLCVRMQCPFQSVHANMVALQLLLLASARNLPHSQRTFLPCVVAESYRGTATQHRARVAILQECPQQSALETDGPSQHQHFWRHYFQDLLPPRTWHSLSSDFDVPRLSHLHLLTTRHRHPA